LTAEEGGKRINGIGSGYRPNHIFEFAADGSFFSTYTYMGDMQFSEPELIYPGDEVIATVRFTRYEPIFKYIQVGRKWFINEAQHRIADGEILEIINL
jgi:hypothetical protein